MMQAREQTEAAVISAELFARAVVRTAEQRLMAAILEDALRVIGCGRRRTPKERRLARQAERWLDDDDSRYVFSFLNVCDVLQLDPWAIRMVAHGLTIPPIPEAAVARA